jgi:hypothetical protein
MEIFRIDDRITVEVDPRQELYREKQALAQLKHRLFRPLKRLAQGGIGAFIKGQVGSLMGTLGASAFPAIAVSGALLIASLALYFSLIHPQVSSIAPAILGMALGVIAHV